MFADMEEATEKKMAEALKASKSSSKTVLSSGKKSQQVFVSTEEYFEGD